MPSTYVARDASMPVVAEEARARSWEHDPAQPLAIRDRTAPEDDLRGARGIFAAVLAGALIWGALGWAAVAVIARIQG